MVIMTATGMKIYHSPTSAEESVLGSAVSPAVAVFEADGTNHKVYCQVSYYLTVLHLTWPCCQFGARGLRLHFAVASARQSASEHAAPDDAERAAVPHCTDTARTPIKCPFSVPQKLCLFSKLILHHGAPTAPPELSPHPCPTPTPP